PAALDVLWAVNVALGSIDRLEVRGRDSAGLHLLLVDHGMDLDDEGVRSLLGARLNDPLFTSMAARAPSGALSLVYKAAAEIGELGDNVAALRAAVRGDGLLGLVLRSPSVRATVLGHTRWASVGVISQANAHPLNSDELDRPTGPYVTAALNGDVDNHGELRLSEALRFREEVTTDAKVIPALVSRRMADGLPVEEAFRTTVTRFEGSVAIAASAAGDPDRLHLALRGSGQSLYVGLAEDAFVVASEPYGLVEETADYVRMDGEVTRGQVVTVERAGAGTLAGMTRRRYDGGDLPLDQRDVTVAQITTRDIDRGGFPHFLLKEISEAPSSFRKTLRGKVLAGRGGRLTVGLGSDAVPGVVAEALAGHRLRRILVIGQGTAAVAGRAAAAAFAHCLPEVAVTALPATELSGFGLADDMADTLVVAISQSGTTTDTNRTVDLVRARGAAVVAVVNRRNSDLAAKADGVLYTSDGRDVEMSVASTKAFYAQVAAGWLLALALADASGRGDPDEADRLLRALRRLPDLMEEVLERRPDVARIAGAVAPPRRYWTVVGSGPDAVAAAEVRIKLSELCYRSIACDTTEDKKHIDLSCEPLILVCAAALSGPNADDVAKEVAIYRAHKAVPVVIASATEAERFAAAREVIAVPPCEPELAFVLAAMVGHLFGYEAALAIDAQALPLRAARAVVEGAAAVPADDLLRVVGPGVADAVAPLLSGLAAGAYDGNLEASTAVRLMSLLRYVTGLAPVDGYELESGKVGSPGVIVADLYQALSDGIDELTRPVDAIKHQAKTVTVGTSRSEDALLALPLVKEALAAGASSDALGYRSLRTLAHLDPAVQDVLGYTRYRIEWPEAAGAWPTAVAVDRGGIALGIPSRTWADPRLRGTKRRAAEERQVTVARGGDGRTILLVPEVKHNVVTGMTLLHVALVPTLPAAQARAVLSGYRGRYNALRDAVTETEPSFEDGLLEQVPLVELLT
ncbi:MAG TPA: SIS domain-containing protein, partial [Acidimicrobiales bacterium]|nr:SIS domain-containing protein [Acidimicrobiales bacterium]